MKLIQMKQVLFLLLYVPKPLSNLSEVEQISSQRKTVIGLINKLHLVNNINTSNNDPTVIWLNMYEVKSTFPAQCQRVIKIFGEMGTRCLVVDGCY